VKEYLLKIKLLTDAVFGSGNSVAGFIDADVLHDKYGFLYINGKTLKGKLGEMASVFVNMIKGMDDYEEIADILGKKKEDLFGVAEKYNHNKLKFSDCEISKSIKEYYKYYMKDSGISPEEILESLTHVESQTSIDNNGIAKKNSLRNFRVINRGIILYSSIYSPKELDDYEKILLAASCSMLRHLGSNETKGKGEVEVSLWIGEKEVTEEYIRLLEKKVKANV
jgi:CRISPR-associated protein Csx10